MAPADATAEAWSQPLETMTASIRQDGEAVSPRTSPTMTPPYKEQLIPVSDRDATPGFRLLYNPTPELGDGDDSEVAFVVEKPRSAYRFDIWTRAGCRTDDDAASLETWKSVFEEQSQRVDVPAWAEALVLEAWAGGEGQDADICSALQQVHCRFSSRHENAIAPNAGAEVSER